MDGTDQPHYTGEESIWQVMQERSGNVAHRSRDGESWKLVDAFLSGGAPWGFTLRGGLEHREPLLITKVEEGSKAAAVSLQVGDELININEIPLSGYRQEAICLVKGSHKTLSLVVKRRNEPISRPHSWHATKFNESHSETTKTQSPPATVWHTKYDASSSSTDLSTGWEQTNLRRVSDQFSSLGSMDSLEHASHPHPAGLLSPEKSNNSMEHLGGGKRDSAYSSFSTSSGTPDYTLSKSNAASTENVLYKVSQWDTGGKNGNIRNSQCLIEVTKQDDRPGHFHMPRGNARCSSPPAEDQAGSRHSTSSRSSYGPVWHVPEKKKTASSSPPPPLPPARSDSFAATKVHERGLIVAHAEGPDLHVSCKPNEKAKDNRGGPSDDANKDATESHSQFSSNKQYSFSSIDIRLGQPPHTTQPHHSKQHSDKSTFHSQPCAAVGPKPQNVSTYYCSMQELPTNGSAQQFGHKRNLSSSQSTSATEQSAEISGHNQYYCASAGQPTQSQSLSGKLDDRKISIGLGFVQRGSELNSNHQSVNKGKYQPQQHQNSSHSNGHNKHNESLHYKQPLPSTPPTLPDNSTPKSSFDERGSQKGQSSQNTETQYLSYLPVKQSEQRQSLPVQHKELLPDMRHQSQINSMTPMLQSLSMDAAGQEEIMKITTAEGSLESKQINRTERFATTLRNEIQIRRAKLQKSKSAATLPDAEGKNEEDHNIWKSSECSSPASADGSFTNTYKDHLKEAQARVLKATSFKRKDLEPVLAEHSAGETVSNYPPSVLRKDITLLPTVSESGLSKSGTGSVTQVTRIGGRKRFSAEKKVRSFSEPDKINEMGVKDASHNETTSSFVEEQQLLKETGKLEFPQCVPIQNFTENFAQPQGQDRASTSDTENILKGIRNRAVPPPELTEKTEDPALQHSVFGQQRLGTFAEYEARWSIRKKAPETKASGRYRSADNILDPRAEERTKATCFHERSRSSPSADFYGQKVPVPGRKSEGESSHSEREPVEQLSTATGFSSRGPSDCKLKEKSAEFDRYTAKTPPPATGARDTAATSMDSVPPQPEDHSEPLPGRRRKPSAEEKSPPVRSSEISNSHTCFSSSQSEVVASSHPDSTHGPTHSPTGESEQGKGLVDKGQGAVASHRASVRATMAGQRSPSPQFCPQRLSDKPPITFQDENSNRIQNKIEDQNAVVRKVPIRIVHSGGAPEKENCPFLQYSGSPVIDTERSGTTRISSLGAAGQESVFCAFTRQREPDATLAPQTDHNPETDVHTSPVTDHVDPTSPQQLTDQFSGYRGGPKTSLCDEDQKREELVRDIMGKDKSLADILDQSKMKTTMDLMEGIFPQGGQLLEGAQQRKKVSPKPAGSRCAEEREKEDSMAAAVTMVTSSAYYSTSAPKAELLIKMKDMQEQEEEEDSEDELDPDLANKKQELIDSLSKKLQVLREARESLQEDILDNNALGDEVEVHVQQVCKPNELDKFRMFVGDLDKVVSLLLSLSGRLARVENALNSLEEDTTPEERRTLMEKRKLLIRQHEDAKELKENLDRRERVVYDILASYLQGDRLTDYEHFVKMKSALIIEQRKLEDKIKLGEEQLKCLMDSLPIEQRLCF